MKTSLLVACLLAAPTGAFPAFVASQDKPAQPPPRVPADNAPYFMPSIARPTAGAAFSATTFSAKGPQTNHVLM